MLKNIVTIYTDGACKGNPGIGAWAATLEYQGHKKEISGVVLDTTNNKMELAAVIEALRCIKWPCSIIIYTDSQYVQKGMTEWITNWKLKNWKNVKNADLWQLLDQLAQEHQITWHWVEGHSGNPGNEYVDYLCNQAIKNYK
ncbi:MAG: ribonuclease HI [Neisseriaceae bacterium]|jgi:ribonuclease HI